MAASPCPGVSRRSLRTCLALALATGVAGLAGAPSAEALNYVSNTNGDSWAIEDQAIPGLDTGSVHNTSTGSLQGFGGIRVHVENAPGLRMNGVLMRGFGLSFDGVNAFSSTHAVDLGGVSASRAILINRSANWARFLDSFTNTGKQAVSIQVAFGGQLGYQTGLNQSAVVDTSSGDTTITPADRWAEVDSPSAGSGSATQNGPSAVVIGTPAPFAGALAKTGNFLRNPFDNPLAASGDEANHYGYVNQMVIQPGQTRSLVHFVVTGLSEKRATPSGGSTPAAGSEVAAVRSTASSLSSSPAFGDLDTGQICSLANWDVSTLSVSGFNPADCTFARPVEPIAHLAAEPATITNSPYDVRGKTITAELADMAGGTATAQQIVRAYLDRIAAYDMGPFGFHAFVDVAPDAMDQARAADVARANGSKLPLLGVPIVVKDIFDTKDMPTTGGSLVFDGFRPVHDAFQIAQLRAAGAIIIGKANLAEFATDGHFSPSAFGQVWNAFDPSKSSIGSSGGSAVAVATSMAGAAMGTQTGDSLWGPSSAASLYSLRGTDGMQSADGVMPLTYIQDYAGTIARSLPDLAHLLNVLAVPNSNDPLTTQADGHRPADWTPYLKADALQGKTIGVPATAFSDPFGTTGTSTAMAAQIDKFRAAGAKVVSIPDPPAAPASTPGDKNYEGWLKWIQAHPENPYTDVPQITLSQKRVPLFRSPTTTYTGPGPMTDAQIQQFLDFRAKYRDLLKQWMDQNSVDAVVFPGQLSDIHLNDSIQPSFGRRDPQSSAAGVPTVIFPAGVNDHGQPINLQLEGRAFSDPQLMGYAYAFGQVAGGHVETDQAPALQFVPGSQPQPIVINTLPAPVTSRPPGSPAPISEALPTKPSKATRPASLLTRTAVVDRRGRFGVVVSCASGHGTCTLHLVIRRGGHVLLSRRLKVGAGRRVTVRLTAPRSLARSLARRGARVRVVVSLSAQTAGATVVHGQDVITLRRR